MAYPTSQIIVAKVDNVDDVLAIHVNELQTAGVNMTLRYIKNTSAATVAANDVGYIDEAGEFKLTTTAYLGAVWAVVVVGGANNADIVVAVGGSKIVVILNGNCSIGDYLYTSTTTKQAQPQSYVRPEVFAIATTANAGGAGGTCEALLLTSRVLKTVTDAQDVFRVTSSSDSAWVTTMNGGPAGAVITYNVAVTGNEDSIVPALATHLGKLVLWNTSKSPDQYALIDSVNTGANTITVATAADVSSWLDTEAIRVTSVEVTTAGIPAAYDIQIEDATVIPELAVGLTLDATVSDAGNGIFYVHPWETYGAGKVQGCQNGGAGNVRRTFVVPLVQRRFCAICDSSGASTCTYIAKVTGYVTAAP